MSRLFKRLSNRLKMTNKNFKNDAKFSHRLAVFRLKTDVGGRLGFTKMSEKAKKNKDEWILNYLRKQTLSVRQKYENDASIGDRPENAVIWVCWWTGVDSAPALVKKCIESIKKHAGNHSVQIITKDNYGDFINVPGYIMSKVQSATMGYANFSDYLRISLLEKYGGLWLDATIFCSADVPDLCFALPFYTCKSEVKKGTYLSEYQWTSFCIGGYAHNIFFKFLKDAFEVYWQNNETAVDYLLIDYLIYIAKESNAEIKRLMELVPINNVHRDDLQAAMNRAADPGEWDQIIRSDTVLYKLSWRESYSATTPDGKESIYGYFLRKN